MRGYKVRGEERALTSTRAASVFTRKKMKMSTYPSRREVGSRESNLESREGGREG